MSSTNVVVGQVVKLDVLVEGAGSSKFPRSVLLDEDNSPIAESPLDLTHVSGDLYSGTFVMPDTGKVTCITSIYSDSGHTTLDEDYGQVMDEFVTQAGSVPDLITKVEQLVNASTGAIKTAAQTVDVDVESNEIDVTIEPENTQAC